MRRRASPSGQAPQIEHHSGASRRRANRETLIRAEVQISTTEDNLRTLILDPARPDYWDVRLEPTDTIQLTPREIDVDAAIKNALANRLDLTISRRNLEITDLNIRVSQNATSRPWTSASTYSATGTGGTQLDYSEGCSRRWS